MNMEHCCSGGSRSTRRKPCPGAPLITTITTRSDLTSNADLRSDCSKITHTKPLIGLIIGYFLPHGATSPSGVGPPHYRGFTITLRHTTDGKTPLEELSARRRDLYLTTHNTYKRKHKCPGVIRTHNHSKRATADPRLRRLIG
jgi:hypothetical protein